MGLDVDISLLGSLIRSRDTRELLDLTRLGLFVQALGVTLLDDLERSISKDFDERDASSLVESAGGITVLAVGADEGGDSNSGSVSKELGNFTDTADVLGAVVRAKAEVLVQTEADVVTVQTVGRNARVEQGLLKRGGEGGLARGRQTGEPDCETLLAKKVLALLLGNSALVPGNVGRHDDQVD